MEKKCYSPKRARQFACVVSIGTVKGRGVRRDYGNNPLGGYRNRPANHVGVKRANKRMREPRTPRSPLVYRKLRLPRRSGYDWWPRWRTRHPHEFETGGPVSNSPPFPVPSPFTTHSISSHRNSPSMAGRPKLSLLGGSARPKRARSQFEPYPPLRSHPRPLCALQSRQAQHLIPPQQSL